VLARKSRKSRLTKQMGKALPAFGIASFIPNDRSIDA